MVNIKNNTSTRKQRSLWICVWWLWLWDGFCCSLSPPSQNKQHRLSLDDARLVQSGYTPWDPRKRKIFVYKQYHMKPPFDLQLQFSVWQRSQLLNKTQKQQWLGIYYTFRLAVSGSISYHMSMLLFKISTIKIFRTFKDNHDFTRI